MKRTLIQNAVIVNEGRKVLGSVVIENEKIAEILVGEEKATAPCDEVIDASGCYLLPGAIDEHVHFRDPGLTHKADITTESHAAAAGGVTSIMDMPNTNPQTTTLEALEEKFTLLGEKSAVNYSCYFGATNNNYTQFAQLDKHRVCGVKLFMGSSTGNMLVDRMQACVIYSVEPICSSPPIAKTRELSKKIRINTRKNTETMYLWLFIRFSVRKRLAIVRPSWLCNWHGKQMPACTSCIFPPLKS